MTVRLVKCLSCAMRGRSDGAWHEGVHRQKLEVRDEAANTVTSVEKDCLIIEIYE